MSEEHFINYRKHLSDEVIKLSGFIQMYRTLNECIFDYNEEINFSPAFFSVVNSSLFTSIILWTSKLFDPKSERGFLNFLNHIKSNIGLFSKDKFKKRKNIDNNHWLFRHSNWTPITIDDIASDIKKISENDVLKRIHLRRNKFHAHFDKEYFFDRQRLQKNSSFTWNELEDIRLLMKDLLNKYSVGFDGSAYSITAVNIHDLRALLDIVREHRIKLDKEFEQHKGGT